MSETRSEEISELAGATAVEACWVQWAALGSPAASVRRVSPSAIVDVEALILLSVHASERERRLADLVSWWARVGSGLTSVQRFRSVADAFPVGGQDGLSVFASLAEEAGDRRWSRHVDPDMERPPTRNKGTDAPNLSESCALWPRLRAGFGVGAKADALAYLLGSRGAWASTKEIAFATGYSTVAARSATTEMALARFIRETGDRPVQYSAPPESWAALLELPGTPPEAPPWRFWSEIFAFLAGATEWSRSVSDPAAPGSHVLASRARDLLERHTRAFAFNRIAAPDPDGYRGLAAVEGLLATTRVVAEWVKGHL
jgi:hypothetical protein